MTRYSKERKDAVLKKLLPPISMSVAQLAREEGISDATLYYWRKQAIEAGLIMPTNQHNSLSPQIILAIVAETYALNEHELSEYCRKKGLYPQQVKQWREQCYDSFMDKSAADKASKKEQQRDKHEIKLLKKELRIKEKALAETAALLVLRKKLRAFYGEDNEDD